MIVVMDLAKQTSPLLTMSVVGNRSLVSFGPVFDSDKLKQTHMHSPQRIVNQMPWSMTSTTNQRKLRVR